MAKRRINRKTRNRKMRKINKRYSRKMRGGQLNEQELMQKGFTSEQITALHNYGIDNMNLINMSLQQVNPQTGALFTPQELIDSLNDAMNESANLDTDDNLQEGINPPSPEMNYDELENNNHFNNFEQGPGLDIQDLGPYSPRSVAEEPYGGRRMRRMRSKKMRSKKLRKTYKGGACYGNGVGANSFDPNYSIFNTRELQLFPYIPK